MFEKKKVAFYAISTSGHFNFCTAVASTLLKNYSDELEIYFFTDEVWAEKLSKVDSRFKFEIYDYKEKKESLEYFISGLEPLLSLPNLQRTKSIINMSITKIDNFLFTDKKVSKLIKKLKPDYIFCDFLSNMPSVVGSKIPYSFLISCNPLVLDVEGYPYFGLDCSIDEKERIKAERFKLIEIFDLTKKNYEKAFEKENVFYNKKQPVHTPRTEHLSIYSFPKELDYFDNEIKEKYNLLQVDAPVVHSKIPPPFELPEEFSKLPGKIIFVSLGSLFSCFDVKLQKLLDALATLPYKYIVSKGPKGDNIKFPDNRFIGENFVDQLAVLQVVDMMIAHGGNNTFAECFYFGVPSIIIPFMCDQINNAKRIEETGYGYQMNIMTYTKKELKEKIENILTNESLIKKTKEVGQRIRNDNSLDNAVKKFYDYLTRILRKEN